MFANSLKQILKWTLICLFSFTTFNLFISGKIEESIYIEAPIGLVYLNVADLTTWSLWQKRDSTMSTKYSVNSSGLGAKMSWTGIEGRGSLEIVKANFAKSLKNKLIFEESSPTYSVWIFEETNNGTKVTWSFQDELPFYVHFMKFFITPKLKEGLNGLKFFCE